MEKLTEEQLSVALNTVADGLDSAARKRTRQSDFYKNLYPAGLFEINLSDAVMYPPLHPLMVETVEKIVELIRTGKEFSIWADDETQAGQDLTYALAMYDKRYCKLFAECLLCQDLYHEVRQNEDIRDIINKWGLCDETAFILQARKENIGQHGLELIDELTEIYGNDLVNYLSSDNTELINNNEIGVSEETDWGIGYSVKAENKTTHKMVFLNWDENSSLMLVRYNAGQFKVLQYKTPQELKEAAEMLEKFCIESQYSWEITTETASGDLEPWGKPQTPCDLRTLL